MISTPKTVFDDFSDGLQPQWTRTCLGPGMVTVSDAHLRLSLPTVPEKAYADAQIDDYGDLPRARFPWQPPVRMEVRARTSHAVATTSRTTDEAAILRGTAGFGFWNYPFSIRGDILMLPEAVWFFYASPPSNMALVPGSAGYGWKAQVIHTMRPGALLATLPTALATGWGRLTGRDTAAARWLQRLSGAQEQSLDVESTAWHTYTLEWQTTGARFLVDGNEVFYAPRPPMRPLGFVAWLDNQYAIATPRGELRFGTVSCDAQWLELDFIRIESL